MDWLNQLENIIQLPETVTEAADLLMLVLTDAQKAEIAALEEDDLFANKADATL